MSGKWAKVQYQPISKASGGCDIYTKIYIYIYSMINSIFLMNHVPATCHVVARVLLLVDPRLAPGTDLGRELDELDGCHLTICEGAPVAGVSPFLALPK
jgi:hypothetical protein